METPAKKAADILSNIQPKNVATTLHELDCLIEDNPVLNVYKEPLEDVRTNYERLMSFYFKDVVDPQRYKVYQSFISKLREMAYNMEVDLLVAQNQVCAAAYRRAKDFDLWKSEMFLERRYMDEVRLRHDAQESFDKDMAIMLNNKHKEDLELYRKIFDAILVSHWWNDDFIDYLIHMACYSKIRVEASQILVSAITVSAMMAYTDEKAVALLKIYHKVFSPLIKQRALVGFVLVQDGKLASVTDEKRQEVLDILAEEDTEKDLQSLQKQIIICMDTPKIANDIQDNVMPDIMNFARKNGNIIKSNLKDTSVEEIINSEMEDELAERLDKSMGKMREKEMAGEDVSYHSFSKMKSYGFFHVFSNWFIPYFMDNPDVWEQVSGFDNSANFLQFMMTDLGVCDNDKYSFIFVMKRLVDTMPGFKEMAKEFPCFDPYIPRDGKILLDPVLIRRDYLQCLYRFFTLAPMRDALPNPFVEKEGKVASSKAYFLTAPLFHAVDKQVVVSVCRFLAKRKDYHRLHAFLLPELSDTEDKALMSALCYKHEKDYAAAIPLLLPLVMMKPEKTAWVKMLADCFRLNGNYSEALDTYAKLPEVKRGKADILLSQIECRIQMAQKPADYDEVLKYIYELTYKYPDQIEYVRLLAQTLVKHQEYAKAIHNYEQLQSLLEAKKQKFGVEDRLYLGAAYMANGNHAEAYRHLSAMVDMVNSTADFKNMFEGVWPYLKSAVKQEDYDLMYDILLARVR